MKRALSRVAGVPARPLQVGFIAIAAGACAAPPPANPADAVARVEVAQDARPASACRPVRLVREGLSGCLPGEAEPVAENADFGELHGLRAEVDVGASRKAKFMLVRLRRRDARAPLSRVAEPSEWHRIERTREIEVDGYPGRVTEGLINPDTRLVFKTIAVGDSVFAAEVKTPVGVEADPRLVDAFLSAFRVEVPWRIRASAEHRYTVAVPAPAIVDTHTKSSDGGDRLFTTIFGLGGRDDLYFGVVYGTVRPDDRRSVDEMFDDGVEGFARGGDRAILKMTDLADGWVRGREVIARSGDGLNWRMRIFVASRRIYVINAAAKRAEALSGATVTRFFESFQITEP